MATSIFRWFCRKKTDREHDRGTEFSGPDKAIAGNDTANIAQEGHDNTVDDAADVSDGPDFDL